MPHHNGGGPKKRVNKNQQASEARTSTANTPSLDNQLERHWLNALHARSGWPRCNVELSKPAPINPKTAELAINKCEKRLRSRSPKTINPASPNPSPDIDVKKMIDHAGCINSP